MILLVSGLKPNGTKRTLRLISVRIISIFYVAALANTDSNFPFQNQKAAIYKNQNIVRSIFYLQ